MTGPVLPLPTPSSPTGTDDESATSSRSSSDKQLEWKSLKKNMRTPRCRCATAVVGNQLVVMGGHVGNTILNSVEAYNLDTGVWSDLPAMSTKRDGCTAVAVGGLIFVFGGYDGNTYLSSVECFSFDTGRWTWLPSMAKRRWGSAAVAVENQIYVVGGNGGNSCALASAEVFNVDTGLWGRLPHMRRKREGCAAVAIGHCIYVLGGYGNTYENSCEVFNIRTGRWTSMANMGLCRSACAAVAVGQNQILVMGGQFAAGQTSLSSVESYNLETHTWTPMASMKTRRRGCATAMVGQVVVVVGGSLDGISALRCGEQLSLDASIPSPPRLPPIPNLLGRRDRAAALERWLDQAQQMKENFEETVASAQTKYRRELRERKAQLEAEIQSVEREHNHKLDIMESMARPWFKKLEDCCMEAKQEMEELKRKIKDQEKREVASRSSSPAPSYHAAFPEPPPELVCPITLELMRDPVIASDGHTYERFAMERVLNSTPPHSNPRSPKTGEWLVTRMLFPNVAIRTLCREYEQAHSEKKTKKNNNDDNVNGDSDDIDGNDGNDESSSSNQE